jgi:broad specificity phosphatase PhoE
MKTKLIFVRHGDLVGERKDILHTPDDQVSLSELGIKQMEDISEILKSYRPEAIFSSFEKRTVDSSRIIAQKLSIDTRQIKELRGRDWGEFAGKTWEEVGKHLAGLSLDERYEFVPPGGESWRQFEGRQVEAITSLAEQNIGKTLVFVSHGSSIRVLLPPIFHISKEESLKLYPDYGTLSIADFEDGKFEPVIFNESSKIT